MSIKRYKVELDVVRGFSVYRYKEKSLPENADLQALMLSEQISRDYIELLRTIVAPEILDRYGLKLREIRVIMCLASSASIFMSASEVADYLRQDKATIARSSITLIGMKYIHTAPNLDDSRVKNLYLTDIGAEAARACLALFEQRLAEIQSLAEMEDSILDGAETLEALKTLESRSRHVLQLAKRTKKFQS